MVNEIIVELGVILSLILGIGLIWFASVRLIGRGVPFTNPETFVRYPQITITESPTCSRKIEPQRYVELDGAANFRDLGGYQTVDHRQVKWGLVYRSEALGRLSDRDLTHLNNLGLRLICDLRTPSEIRRVPDRVPQNTRWAATPTREGDFDMSMLPTLLFNRKIIPDLMRESYTQQLEKSAVYFGAILSHFATPDNLPVVFHCSAGKDRAGLTAALLLGLLGVPEKTIVEDYTYSNLAYDTLYIAYVNENKSLLRPFGIPMKELHPMLIADPKWMENALNFISTTYGSVQNYLLQAAGMDIEDLERIKENLLV
jgi:protein-tyrosine phosphatase